MFKVYKISPTTWAVSSGVVDPPRETGVFTDELDAEEFCTFLNRVYEHGQKSVQSPIKAALGIHDVGN